MFQIFNTQEEIVIPFKNYLSGHEKLFWFLTAQGMMLGN